MSISSKTIERLDHYQRQHFGAGFIYGVIKKYGDDQAGNQAALITYYGFLSLFPLLIVATSLIQLLFHNHPVVHQRILSSLGQYFPAVSSELTKNLHSLRKSGVALVISLLITFYGAQGAAGAIQNSFNHLWAVPRYKRPGFPKSTLKSLGLTIVGGLGLLLAAGLSSLAASLGHGALFRIFASLISLGVIVATLWFVFSIATNAPRAKKFRLLSAAVAGVGLQILQTLGGYIMTHELKNLSLLYGTFAVVLGLMFWIYLQTQLILWITEAGVVGSYFLWPRSINQKQRTAKDQLAINLYEQRERLIAN